MTLDTDFKTIPVTAGGGRAQGVDTRRMTLDAEVKTTRALSRGGATMQRETATVFFLSSILPLALETGAWVATGEASELRGRFV